MNTLKLNDLKKKGSASVDSKISYLIGALIVIVLAVNVAPEMFSSLTTLNGTEGTPSWVTPVLFVVVGAGLIFLIWKAFGGK